MIINDYKHFAGQHCETTATGNLLHQLGLEYSEPLMFGLGEGLGFGYFSFKGMDFPFIGGRVRTGDLAKNICRNLSLDLDIKETTSIKKAWKNVEDAIAEGRVVGLQLDCYHLEYFGNRFHFGGHFAALYGLDSEKAYLMDTEQQGGMVSTSLKSLELARNEKGPMTAKNLSFLIKKTDKEVELSKAVIQAIYNNAKDFLNPPIKNLGFKGILKASDEIIKWFERSENRSFEFERTAILMERGGTGGALFRNLYRDFLKEAAEITGIKELTNVSTKFREIALKWNEVADLFLKAASSDDIEFIHKASSIMKDLHEDERNAMQELYDLVSPTIS